VTIDRVVLAFAALVIVLAAASGGDEPAATVSPRPFDGWAVALLVVSLTMVAVAGGRFPAMVALAAVGVTLAWYGIGYTSGLVNVVALVAFYRLGTSHEQRRKVGVAAIAGVIVGFNMVVVGAESWRSAAEAIGYLVMALLFGELIRSRRLVIEDSLQRARRAELETERRVTEERMRIARDVHDVLAHTVAAMTVQAGLAADSLDRDPEGAAAAVGKIRRAGREAMNEVRATVALMRVGDDLAVTVPSPRIERVDELVDAARDYGIMVNCHIAVGDGGLPDLVELTVFRVVQESLTNVVRHAHASTADVTIETQGCSLVVEVRDDGSAADDRDVVAGFGLRGMAERVESIGGELYHGRDGSGWLVRAVLPIAQGSS
jgi:signal transduction histidine kinase